MVIVGGPNSIYIPELPKSREGRSRLRGVRFIHTNLKNEPISQDDLMDLIFLRLDLIGIIGIDTHGGAVNLRIAHILPSDKDKSQGFEILPPVSFKNLEINFLDLVQALENELERNRLAVSEKKGKDRAILISLTTAKKETAVASINELKELATTSGITVVDKIIQKQREINAKYLIGKGKLSEIILRALQHGVDLLIFDQELNPSQIRSITDTTELRVIDRTQLILDIFAQRAHSREGKIQVEMAQLKYLLPRINVKDDALSRLTGGIGARGPGETKLEINRRRIKDRIANLEHELKNISKSRGQRRSLRTKKDLPVISIVGYTNAGKSTLLNTLTHSHVFVENQLFATLDPTSRRLRFPKDFEVIITDTVGFIQDLPKELLDAFASTLEELCDADLLLHVADVSNPQVEKQIDSVNKILTQLDIQNKPTVIVFNKTDIAPKDRIEWCLNRYKGVAISALSTKTIEPLIDNLQELLLNSIITGIS